MSALARQSLPSSFGFINSHYPTHHSSKPHLLLHSKPIKPCLCLSSTPPILPPQSSPQIFLPFLQQQEQQQLQKQAQEDEEEEEEEDPVDPILRFFKSQTSTQDPPRFGKVSLQKNRRSSWHLRKSFNKPKNQAESDIDNIPIVKQETQPTDDSVGGGNVEEILRIARNLPENSTLGEMLGGYEGRVSRSECVQALELMAKDGLLRCCLYLYEWMRLHEPSLVTPRTCSVLFPLLGRARMGDELIVLFQNLPKNKEFRDVHVYNAAISGLFSCGRYDDAWRVYEAMETNNVCPDHVTCTIVITVMRKNGRSAKEAWEFFERMTRKGVKWSEEIMGALIKSFCDEGLKNEALIIHIEMEKRGILSNAIIYNTLMHAYCKSNQIEEAEGLYHDMKAKGFRPTSATFNILMDAYSRRMQPEIVEKLLLEMQDIGLEPNAKSYTCLISAYGRQRKMSDMAADAFLKMKKVGIKPTSHSYTALIHAYSVSGWHEKAYTVFENMRREGIKPSIETYTALLDAFRRAGDAETLMKIWKSMMNERIEGTRVTFNTLVDGFAKQGHYCEARDVISEFGKIGLQPTLMTYNMLMNAYARGGQTSKLPQLLKEMAALNLKPDSVTYSTMIYAYVRVRDFKRAFFYHKQMVKKGQVPDVKSYEKLRSILDVKAATKNRKDRSAILGIINSKMGMVKARKKGKKDEFWKYKIRHPKTQNIDDGTFFFSFSWLVLHML
ncbi:hypothetical protein QYF36_004532 [Acer negundo]|nr:hypothetical protein QYF36_004532 [Acer negundo]